MHAVVVTEPGDVDALSWAEAPDPTPSEGEVVIDVAASAVNRADLLQRQGFYPPPPGASDIIRLECSGRIAAAGGGVSEWADGDEVCGALAGGGHSEQVAIAAAQWMPRPAGGGPAAAAALP